MCLTDEDCSAPSHSYSPDREQVFQVDAKGIEPLGSNGGTPMLTVGDSQSPRPINTYTYIYDFFWICVMDTFHVQMSLWRQLQFSQLPPFLSVNMTVALMRLGQGVARNAPMMPVTLNARNVLVGFPVPIVDEQSPTARTLVLSETIRAIHAVVSEPIDIRVLFPCDIFGITCWRR